MGSSGNFDGFSKTSCIACFRLLVLDFFRPLCGSGWNPVASTAIFPVCFTRALSGGDGRSANGDDIM